MAKQTTDEDLDLLEELGVEVISAETSSLSAKQQRIIAGFEEIMRFVEENKRIPEHGESRDIFERLYAVRLDRIRESEECRGVLKGLDTLGLLDAVATPKDEEPASDEDLLAMLGVEPSASDDITKLVHVRPHDADRASPDEVAQRTPCKDFEQFKPIFQTVQDELNSGERETKKYRDDADVQKGDLFILEGQKVLVASLGKRFVAEYGRQDRRLRVVFDNATESDLLLRSLQRALNKDANSRRITDRFLGPLFSSVEEDGDFETGYIYVARSKSDHPFVVEHQALLHKIGVTGGDVKRRVANAKNDPTYLLADVDVVATFKLANINRKKLEALIHKFFARVRLDMELKDRFGSQVEPQEWYLVPLQAIDEAIERIKDGTIENYEYDPETASVVAVE